MPKAGRFRYLEQETDPLLAIGRLIYSPALHISLIKTAYRALSNQVLTVYPSGLTRVTTYIAVKDFVFMEPSATGSETSYASSLSAAGFAQ